MSLILTHIGTFCVHTWSRGAASTPVYLQPVYLAPACLPGQRHVSAVRAGYPKSPPCFILCLSMPLLLLILRQTPLKSLKPMSFCASAGRDALDGNTPGACVCCVALLGDAELCCAAKHMPGNTHSFHIPCIYTPLTRAWHA